MRNARDGLRIATNIWEAALWRYNVRVTCGCGHSADFEGPGLWWLFERKGWNDDFREARRRFWCLACQRAGKRRRVRPARLEAVDWVAGGIRLPDPDEREWKRALRRFRC